MRPDTLSKLAVSVAICAAAASSVAVGLANSRIDDLEIQRDIYKSRAEDWEGTAGVIAQYADDLADELKIRSKLVTTIKATILLVSKFIFAKLMKVLIIVAFRAFYVYNFLHEASSFQCCVFFAETLYHCLARCLNFHLT